METATTSSVDLPGFEEVNLESLSEETLTVEDLESRKKQLWLIKVPYEFDISSLSETTVILNGTQDLSVKPADKGSGKRYETRAAQYETQQSCPFNVVLPSSENGNHLQVAKGFTGYMDVTQTIPVPMLVYPPTPPTMYTDVPKGLKARWKPFGHETPAVIHMKSNEGKLTKHFSTKKAEPKSLTKRTENVNEEERKKEKNSPKKKKIKKKNEEEPEVSSKHKHKKKKKTNS